MHVTVRLFFFNDTATTEIYTLSLHDALPISSRVRGGVFKLVDYARSLMETMMEAHDRFYLEQTRSEEHTSELQSRQYLVCRLLLEKKTHSNAVLPSLRIRLTMKYGLSSYQYL